MNQTAGVKKISGNQYEMEVYSDLYNKRIRLDDYRGNFDVILGNIGDLASETQAEKVIIKGRKEHYIQLLEAGFQCEALIDGYFLGSDAYFFTKYLTVNRKVSEHWITEDGIVRTVQNLAQSNQQSYPNTYFLKKITKEEAEDLAELYQEVFEIYPTPLHNPDYIKKTIDEGTIYYGFQYQNKIVSAASAEINMFYKNAELTDCATLKEHRKHGLMKFLLEQLEEDLKKNGVYCSYSIARALSFGMNAVLHQLGYNYRGRLMNNCYIYDKLEDMNVWVKDLSLAK